MVVSTACIYKVYFVVSSRGNAAYWIFKEASAVSCEGDLIFEFPPFSPLSLLGAMLTTESFEAGTNLSW